ncbi:MAG: hypothetical protein ABMB14_20015 [Myxococcota bacterium]
MRKALVTLVLSVGAVGSIPGCPADEPHECDNGTPTCESSLVVLFPDPRVDFTVHVSDPLGLDLSVDCPLAEGASDVVGDYTLACGAGRLTITTFRAFGETVDVAVEEVPARTFTPDYQFGGDFCGNACTTGSVQL